MKVTRVFAVDWSGRLAGAEKTIWVAEAWRGRLVALDNGRGRDEVARYFIERARGDPSIAVGLDFAFSMPSWFLHAQRCRTAHQLWERAEREGEAWLRACEPPFWGRRGRARPPEIEQYRRCELGLRKQGYTVKSTFQVGGAGSVGTGSIRGMPVLRRLHHAGFSIWPFDPPGLPVVLEIYPRIATGSVVKRSGAARLAHLRAKHASSMPRTLLERAASSEDAFDAAISALGMSAHPDELACLQAGDAVEGAIWLPLARSGTRR
jgi:predicted nuclease with RNAse H fold